MEINATGLASRELTPNKSNIDQELAQRVREKDETIQQNQKALEPRPVDQPSADKTGRIDIYV